MNELDSLLRAAGRMMLDYQSPKVFSKGHHADFVTEADIAVQSYLVDALQRAYPHAKFLAEEEERHVLTDALTFIIDPIDGTTNYFRRRRCSMISIGAVENKLPVFGGLYDPYLDEMYLAERGKGATCNGERILVSDTPLDKALIGFGSAPYYEELFSLTGRTVSTTARWRTWRRTRAFSIICAKCCNQRIAKIPILWYNQGTNLKRSD